MSRLEQARAEIARRRHNVENLLQGGVMARFYGEWMLAVLAAADATLDRHAPVTTVSGDGCADGHLNWPCPDAAAVLDLYAPLGLVKG